MRKRVVIREDGERRHVSGQEAMLLSLFEKALRGDIRAFAQIFMILTKTDPNDAASAESSAVTENDRAVVEAFLQRNTRAAQEGDES
jgi:hypothetical protein